MDLGFSLAVQTGAHQRVMVPTKAPISALCSHRMVEGEGSTILTATGWFELMVPAQLTGPLSCPGCSVAAGPPQTSWRPPAGVAGGLEGGKPVGATIWQDTRYFLVLGCNP